MKRDHFVKRRKHADRLGLKTSLKRDTGGINSCFCPSRDASKADLAEFHAEDMKLRRSHQLARAPNRIHPRGGSIATDRHYHEREKARRLRQMERRA